MYNVEQEMVFAEALPKEINLVASS